MTTWELLLWLFRTEPVFMTAEILFLGFLLSSLFAACYGAPFVPTWNRRVSKMLEFAKPRPGEVWIDLGSGDGRVVIAAAKAGAKSLGLEINPILVLWSKFLIRCHGLQDRAEIHWANIWNVDISQADVISMYLLPFRMKRVQDKIEAQAKPGCRIVIHDFALPDWEPVAQEDRIMLYVKPGPAAAPPAGGERSHPKGWLLHLGAF